jgi:tetratricopeptide (TPR) repeat protein/transcriptional regulator with XRE-family HTH domain
VLKQLLAARGLSQREFAKRSGLDAGYLSKLINGKITEPRREQIVAIAKSLSLTVDELWETVDSESVISVVELVRRGSNTTALSIKTKRFAGDPLTVVPVWFGRDELLDQLRDRLCDDSPLKALVLTGQGGIGKTSLVTKLVQALGVDLERGEVSSNCRFDGILVLDTRETRDLLPAILAGMGIDPKTIEPSQWGNSILAALQRHSWLVVLNNLENMLLPSNSDRAGHAIVPAFGELLNGLVYRSHRSRVLLTSRELPKDLADQQSLKGLVNPKLVRIEKVIGIEKEAGAALLRNFGVVNSQSELEEISDRVKGHVFVLTHLALFAVSCQHGELYRYLQEYPELYTDDVRKILTMQIERRTNEQQQLLKRMGVLRFLTDVQGLTFLRLYENEGEMDEYLLVNDGSLMPSRELEKTETQCLVDELVRASLVDHISRPIDLICHYRLHPVVKDFLLEEFTSKLPKPFQNVLDFYQRGHISNDTDPLQFEAPLWLAQNLDHRGEFQYLGLLLIKLMQDTGRMPQTFKMAESIPGVDKIDVLLEQGGIAYRSSSWDEAEDLYKKALTVATEQNDRTKMTQVISQLASIERNRGNWDGAELLYRQSLQLCEELGDRSGQASCLGCLGDIELNRGNWNDAELLYRQFQEISKELGNRSGMALALSYLGCIEERRSNWDKAEPLYRQSLELHEELGDRPGIASSWEQLGRIKSKRRNWDEADTLYRQSLQLRQELGDLSGVASSLNSIGDSERDRGNWNEAEHFYLQSLQLREDLGDRHGIAWVTGDRGANELSRGNLELAESLLQNALTQSQQLRMTDLCSEIYGYLARLYQAKNNPGIAQ